MLLSPILPTRALMLAMTAGLSLHERMSSFHAHVFAVCAAHKQNTCLHYTLAWGLRGDTLDQTDLLAPLTEAAFTKSGWNACMP